VEGARSTQQIVAVTKARRWPDSTPPPTVLRRPLEEVAAEIQIPIRARRSLVVKRILDVAGSLVGLLVLAPLFLLIGVVVRLTSRGPAIFVQERIGQRGRVFRFYKFRTMAADAEQKKADLVHLNEMRGPVFKIRRDPRITRVGAILRKTSLDELPQFWNVLRGDMSLVGPRPPLREEVERYNRQQAQRLSVTPGLTGLWQVSGRSAIPDFDQWVALDIRYARTWTIWLDIKILLKTVVVVLGARGAQ
jgi:exopolysaccharide biosynthesis polyprenyl glycosylphosphotransferase